MPKLSDYLARAKPPATTGASGSSGPPEEGTQQQQQPPQTDSLGPGSTGTGCSRPTQPLAAPRSTAVTPAHTAATAAAAGAASPTITPAAAPAPALLQQLHDRYAELFRRRLRERGSRCYRHPDGSLRPTPPPADYYSQANRQHWKELVQHARTAGGDPEYQMHGFSLRYGIGVPQEAHRRLCQELDLQEELQPPAAIGDFEGDPLADPDHPFNREWKQLADAVFAAAPHPWRYVGLPGAAAAATSGAPTSGGC
ncbi:hypothetical protein HXX76_007829 [Chlamydomonas incerta]|uniref:Uncharacterized protein n=1 Tax=Chlamydomonas incerta TaxID=51695 RepID=A0A835SZ27_CHLIN|nr:hypothetical protein HXX76_007829 [Chlamydomonas incerta]|eukprot:KAG2434102.1 hypothetical protein HXX76_007829 [Chlamydomonas incerta]